MGIDCNTCKNRNDCGTHIAITLMRTGGEEAFIGCKGYEPTADVVSVVRCKDCIYYSREDCGYGTCEANEYFPCHDESFCSEGKRRI